MITLSARVCTLFLQIFKGRLCIRSNQEIKESINLFKPNEKFQLWGFKRRVVKFWGEVPEELKPFAERDDEGCCNRLIIYLQRVALYVREADGVLKRAIHEIIPEFILPYMQYVKASIAIVGYSKLCRDSDSGLIGYDDGGKAVLQSSAPVWLKVMDGEYWEKIRDEISRMRRMTGSIQGASVTDGTVSEAEAKKLSRKRNIIAYLFKSSTMERAINRDNKARADLIKVSSDSDVENGLLTSACKLAFGEPEVVSEPLEALRERLNDVVSDEIVYSANGSDDGSDDSMDKLNEPADSSSTMTSSKKEYFISTLILNLKEMADDARFAALSLFLIGTGFTSKSFFNPSFYFPGPLGEDTS